MRILQIMAARGNGGAELYSTDIMLSLHEAGVDQCVVLHPAALRRAEFSRAGLRLATDPLETGFRPWQKRRLRQLIEREKPDLIHCWMRRAASLVPKDAHHQAAVVGWYGDYEEYQHFSHCSAFIGVTEDLVRHMRDSGVAADRAFYVPTFPSIEPGAPLDRATLDTPADARVLLTLSRLHPTKGLDTVLQAMPALPDCYLWIAGEGPLRQELEQLARKLNVLERVRFLGWRTDRGALLGAADICLLPSRYEPFGTVILDAWSTRTAFIACESDGPRAYIRDGENGMLVPADAPAALAAAIRRVLDEPALKARIEAGGHAEFRAGFTREAVTRRMIDCYQTILQSSRDDKKL
jgi:glycosyltransferase involved in cell wall biosynthesis